jgi:hypothetical protein
MQPTTRSSWTPIAALGAALALAIAMALAPKASRAADTPRTVVQVKAQKVVEILNTLGSSPASSRSMLLGAGPLTSAT